MKNLIKIAGLTIAVWLLTPSCASYKHVTFEPCLPKEKITLRERAKNYMDKSDSSYTLQSKEEYYLKNKQLRFDWKLMGF